MKIIDLLNKIANGEEVPNKIRYFDRIWEFNEYGNNYYDKDGNSLNDTRLIGNLNEKVEILEEKKLPEKLDLTGYWDKNSLKTEEWCSSEEFIVVKINEMLDYLESKEKGE